MFIEHSQPPEKPELPTEQELSDLLGKPVPPAPKPWERPEVWAADYERDFSEALMMVQHGFRARRACWDRRNYIKAGRAKGHKRCLIECHLEDDLDVELYTPTPEDLFAKDWIVSR